MNIKILCKTLTLFCLYPLAALAAKDPVSWSLQPASGFQTTPVGNQSTIQYTLTNELPQAVKLFTIITTTGQGFNIHNECNQSTVQPKASCNIAVAFMPKDVGSSSFQLSYGYHNNRI